MKHPVSVLKNRISVNQGEKFSLFSSSLDSFDKYPQLSDSTLHPLHSEVSHCVTLVWELSESKSWHVGAGNHTKIIMLISQGL